jgi:acetyl-CoA decarbonylase/synthase complex subunit gamma
LADLTQFRRLAIKKKYRPFGYPTVAFTTKTEPLDEIVEASVYVAKYASVVVLKAGAKEQILPLLTLRDNLYTDPQKPIQVEPVLHSVGEVNENSPLYITTNFSLTYYSVEGEVESSKIPSYILPIDTDGTSVLTAYAAGKFEPEKIAEAMAACGIADKVSHRNVIIPGYVAVISGKLQEVSGWKVLVGPREASGIVSFAKTLST